MRISYQGEGHGFLRVAAAQLLVLPFTAHLLRLRHIGQMSRGGRYGVRHPAGAALAPVLLQGDKSRGTVRTISDMTS